MIYVPPPDEGLRLIHEDGDCLVLDKPAGLLTVPGRGAEKADCLAFRVQKRFPEALIVHRLDMGTSGLVLMARSLSAQREFNRLFEQRRIEKRYLAVVRGRPQNVAGLIDLPLITDWPNRPRQMVDYLLGKPSQTRYQVLSFDPLTNTSRLALDPLTGRSHQLRVHLQALGHSILGDELYADEETRDASPRLLLHAERLAFRHPFSGQELVVDCPLPF